MLSENMYIVLNFHIGMSVWPKGPNFGQWRRDCHKIVLKKHYFFVQYSVLWNKTLTKFEALELKKFFFEMGVLWRKTASIGGHHKGLYNESFHGGGGWVPDKGPHTLDAPLLEGLIKVGRGMCCRQGLFFLLLQSTCGIYCEWVNMSGVVAYHQVGVYHIVAYHDCNLIDKWTFGI